MSPNPTLASAIFAAATSLASTAQSSVMVDIFQDGTDVQMDIAGSFDTTGGSNTSFPFTASGGAIDPNRFFGVRTGAAYFFETFANTGPSNIGPGTSMTTTSVVSGDVFFFNFGLNRVGLETGYVSGSALSSSATFLNTTLSGLGLAEGNYVWDFTNGEMLTVKVSAAPAVPLPAGGLLLIGGIGAFAVARKRQHA